MNASQNMTQDDPKTLQGDVRVLGLLKNIEILKEEVHRLKSENLELNRKLMNVQLASRMDRDTRRAALNLMEDAENARRAEQRENAERRQAEDELRNADRRKDEFLATLAHELRNPLAPIRNSIHILKMKGSESESVLQTYDMMERQVNQLVRLVDDLMEVSRITRGKIELQCEILDIAAVISTAVETSRPLIDKAGHELAISISGHPLHVRGDPVRLSQVLSNLLNNAAKYTDDHGHIWLDARRDHDQVVVIIRDDGIGITPHTLPRVFDLFTQCERGYSKSQGGLGIGLTLAQTLVHMHGGSISVSSAGSGQGSEFTVRLPAIQGVSRGSENVETNFPRTQLFGCRILIADDNHDAAQSLAILLERLGAEVVVAFDSVKIIKLIEDFHPTIVFLDIGMPKMDGNQVACEIRKNWGPDQIALIALTGWGQDEDRRRTRDAGFNLHLVKPVDPHELEKLLFSLSVVHLGTSGIIARNN